MEENKIPRLNYKSPLIPKVIWQHLFVNDKEMKFNHGLDFGRGNAYACGFALKRFKEVVSKDQFNKLIDDYIQGFRQGYYEFTEKASYQVITKALGETFPFVSYSLFSHTTVENGVEVNKIETFSQGLENGQRYKAFEVILNNPLKFESYFNLANEKFKKEKKKDNTALIDNSDTKATEKIIYLKELGVLDFLLTKEPFNLSTNALANVLSSITGEKPETLQSYLNPITSPTSGQRNNPLTNIKKVDEVKQILIKTGFKP